MDRETIDLGTARINEAHPVDEWDFLYIGDCDGNVTIKIGSTSKSSLNPDEFSKIENIRKVYFIYITNTAQAGKHLVLYYERKRGMNVIWQ